MKILHCTNFYTETSGGVKTYLHSVGEEFMRRGMPFRLVVPGDKDEVVEDPEKDSRMYILKSPPFPVNREYRMILPLDFLPRFRFRLGEIVRCEAPDVVEISDLWTLIYLAKALKHRPDWYGLRERPLVAAFAHDRLSDYMVHYFRGAAMRKIMIRLSNWYLRSIYIPSYDLILANSAYTAEELNKHTETGAASNGRQTHVVPLGVDVRTFSTSHRDESLRRSLLSGEEGFLLLYAGRLSREKGLERLMDAMREIADTGRSEIRLLVVGDGSLRSRIEESKPGNVSLLGHVGDRRRLAAIYASCDAFITPSVREGFGISQLEAMASGLPVICPDVAGQMSYMCARAGIVTGHSPEALRDAILRMMNLPAGVLREMRKAARMIAEKYSWGETAERILSIYEKALTRLRGGEENLRRLPAPFESIQNAPRALGVE
ncbi:MAG: glycosyltransferase [Candidatus Glassbacteria bacterium]